MGKHNVKKGGVGESFFLSKPQKLGRVAELYKLMNDASMTEVKGVKIGQLKEYVNNDEAMLDAINKQGVDNYFYEPEIVEGKVKKKLKPGLQKMIADMKDPNIGIGKIFQAIEQMKKNIEGQSHSFPPPTNMNIAKLMKAYYGNMKSGPEENAQSMVPNVIQNHDITELTKRVTEALSRMIARKKDGNKGREDSLVLSSQHHDNQADSDQLNAEGPGGFLERFFQNHPNEDDLNPGKANKLVGGTGGGGFMQSSEVTEGEDASLRKHLTQLGNSNIITHIKWDPNKSCPGAKNKKGEEVGGDFVKKTESGPIIADNSNDVHQAKGQKKSLDGGKLTFEKIKNNNISVLDLILVEMESTTLGGKRKTKKAKKSRKSRKSRKARKSRKGGKC